MPFNKREAYYNKDFIAIFASSFALCSNSEKTISATETSVPFFTEGKKVIFKMNK